MNKIIGIDIGGSTTKIVGFSGGSISAPLIVKATDPIASVYGAFGKYLTTTGLTIRDIGSIMVTGVGSSFLTDKIYGIPTGKVDEFMATGRGGLFLSGLGRAIVVSMGTGTAFVMADGTGVEHMGGTGVGGGTLLGLSNRMLNVRGFSELIEAAQGGTLSNIDLTIGDISSNELTGLPPGTTASNFGKLNDLASRADIAMGIINLVFETVGMLSVFASQMKKTADIVLTGSLTNVPQSRDIFDSLEKLFSVKFHIPVNAEYATAVGAAIAHAECMPLPPG
ncbi:MAG: type II pantothenate kinase [Eubacteriales bacterium]|nr:type II pantothenate kinase [Eubacteriales bacterium]